MTASSRRSSSEAVQVRLLRVLTVLVPMCRRAVVAGAPDDEGNSVELVRSLTSQMPVTWLVNTEPGSLRWLVDGLDRPDNLRILPRDSRRAFWAYLRARYVFFTHGLFGSPPPPRGKIVVNLWHGDGPKRRKGFAYIRSSHVVSGTALWGAPRAEAFGVDPDRVLVTGNPRTDQFDRPASDDALLRLSLDPARPLVLWLPTYRTTDYRSARLGTVRNWSDGPELSGSEQVRGLFEQVRTDAEELGVTLAVKPHPLDADRFAETGLRCLTNDELAGARVTLYQLLGRTRGLMTDYSSVWTDYLRMDRPIGFYCPDLDQYQQTRGLNVEDYRSLLPGPLLGSAADFARFFASCLEESRQDQDRRARCVDRVGAETRPGATSRLLGELGLASSASY